MSNFQFHFKNNLPHQEGAINSTLALFKGMERKESYFSIVDVRKNRTTSGNVAKGVANNISIDSEELSFNLEEIQNKNGFTYNEEEEKEIKNNCIVPKDFTIEMETGTGKTYVYIKTALEMSKQYGIKKFIVVVPSVAIREGVKKTLEITKKHFENSYEPYEYFVYDSSNFSQIKEFGRSKITQIMVINIDAFNSQGNRKIYDIQEQTDGNKPIDIIKETNPVVIIDEPQSVTGESTLKKPTKGVLAIRELNPSMILRYSATHRVRTHELYKLDAVDAYQEGLVKEIVVNSVVIDEDFNEPYIYVVSIDRDKRQAKLRLNVKSKNTYIRKVKIVKQDDDLAVITGNSKYEGFKILEIGFKENNEYIKMRNLIEPLNLTENREYGSTDSDEIKRFQIRQTIREHLEKEIRLRIANKSRGRVKVLSLFFIDKVDNYVTYSKNTRVKNGKFAKMFEEEYPRVLNQFFDRATTSEEFEVLNELKKQELSKIHDGYFSKDKATTFVEYKTDKDGNYKLTSKDDGTFDLIMRDKEKLLSLDNSLRFIFSHSALKEGWDNPNVFQICTLNETKSQIKKRQEIGRGLRLAVDEFGKRIEEGTQRQINKLTIMVNESYEEFAETLQEEYKKAGVKFGVVESDTFAQLPSNVTKVIGGEKSIAIYNFLTENNYLDKEGHPNDDLRKAISDGTFSLPEELSQDEKTIIKKLTRMAKSLDIKDGHEKKTVAKNDKIIASPQFIELWERIKYKTRYEFTIDEEKLIEKGVNSLKDLDIDRLNIISKRAKIKIEDEGISGAGTQISDVQSIRKTEFPNVLLEIQNSTDYSRNDIAKILVKSKKLSEIRKNPERFILEVSKRLNAALNAYLMEEDCIRYVKLGDSHCYVQENIFEETIDVFDKFVVETREKSIYPSFDYDSKIEKEFAEGLENDDNVVLYTKLPSTFKIDTPIGNYNPDWAIVYKAGENYKVYFVIETKGSLNEIDRKGKENYKINCARKHFKALNEANQDKKVIYEVASTYKSFENLGIKIMNKNS